MTDYYTAIKQSVANLPSADDAGLRAYYGRVRRLVLERLRGADPPLSEREIRGEVDALEAALRRLESELRRPMMPRAAPLPAPAPAAEPEVQAEAARDDVPGGNVPADDVPADDIPRDDAAPAETVIAPATSEPEIDAGVVDEFVVREPVMREPVADEPVLAEQATREPEAGEPAAREPETSETPPPQRASATPRTRQLVFAAGAVLAVATGAALVWFMSGGSPTRETASPPPAPAQTQPPASAKPRVETTASADVLPYTLRRQISYYRSNYPPGTLVVSKSQAWLYLIKTDTSAVRYAVGVGPDCRELGGLYAISRKDDAPPGAQASAARTRASGGLQSIYFGDPNYQMTAARATSDIGPLAPSSGIRLMKDDFADLYGQVAPGTRVVMAN